MGRFGQREEDGKQAGNTDLMSNSSFVVASFTTNRMHGGGVIGRLSCTHKWLSKAVSLGLVPTMTCTHLISKPTHAGSNWLLDDIQAMYNLARGCRIGRYCSYLYILPRSIALTGTGSGGGAVLGGKLTLGRTADVEEGVGYETPLLLSPEAIIPLTSNGGGVVMV